MMSESKSPEKKKLRKSLSISKTKKNAPENATPSKSSSIIAFFNNVPPAKFACPICGELVPRFEMNNHLDKVCQKTQSLHSDDVILVEPVNVPSLKSGLTALRQNKRLKTSPAERCLDPVATISPSWRSNKDKTECVNVQASPYFQQDDHECGTHDLPRAGAVNMGSVGSLSSKLSKNCQKGHSAPSVWESPILPIHCEGDESADCGLMNGSQKENQGKENNAAARTETSVTESPAELMITECGSAGVSAACARPNPEPCLAPKIALASTKDIPKVPMSLVGKSPRRQRKSAAKIPKIQGGKKVLHSENSSTVEPCDGSVAEARLVIRNGAATISHADCGNQTDGALMGGGMEVHAVEEPDYLSADIISEFSKPFEEKDLQGDVPENADGSRSSSTNPYGQPYYLRNFLMVLQTVMDNEDDMSLFNEQDTSVLTKFFQLSESELLDVSEVLDLLPAPELKMLAKTFHLDNPNGQKQQLVESFLRLAKQRSIFSFGKNQPGIGAVILKRAKELSGRSVRVCRAPRTVFSRVLLLFSLTDSMEVEEAASGGQTQLSTVLMVNMGRTIFPTYVVSRQTKIFQDREDLIRYETAMHSLIEIAVAMANGKWEVANLLYQCAKDSWKELKGHPYCSHHEKLPVYLRCFTVGWVYTRIRTRGVEILQRLHLYEEAVDELESLLSQIVYCPDSRGRWWDRLALNLHQHLKHTEKAVGHVLEGLVDPFVRTGHRLALYQRAQRIRDSASCKKLRHLFQNMPLIEVEDVPHVTIKGKMFPHTGMGKSVFLRQEICNDENGEGSSLSTVMCSVEDLALAHYRQEGYDQGIHGEGSTFSTLFSLLMWDIIFMEGVPDVFRNAYQAFPLDLYTDSFFENRSAAIATRLELLQEASTETLEEMIADVWNVQQGKAAALVSWERFTSLQQAQSLVACFGGPFLSGVCLRLSKDLRHCRGGLPDLVVWNTTNSSFKVVEVKGPNDRLSHKQMIWLDELRKLGAPVEVCHVVAIGAKSMRIS
ncbi:fanconi-associated nuclease 1 isoform X2 [Ambystoma mexicanum]|uniref:fanconi-associated nuclease 1 isoform X2 n=1 Tax=Ambystoma mexicanum TaxID=8296 RepID=UPI0037E934D1